MRLANLTTRRRVKSAVEPPLPGAAPFATPAIVVTSMSIGIFIAPAPVWRPPGPPPITPETPKTQAESSNRWQLSWEDHAFSKTWQAAVVEYLHAHGNRPAKLWQVINEVAAESAPGNRSELRRNKTEILRAITELKRSQSIMRYRRKWIASLELRSEVVPLDQLKGLYVART